MASSQDCIRLTELIHVQGLKASDTQQVLYIFFLLKSENKAYIVFILTAAVGLELSASKGLRNGLSEQLPYGERAIKGPGSKAEMLGSAVHFEGNPSCSGKGDFRKHFYCFVIILGCWTEICKCNPASETALTYWFHAFIAEYFIEMTGLIGSILSTYHEENNDI